MSEKFLVINLQRFNHLNAQEDHLSLEQIQEMGIDKISLGLSFGNAEFLHRSSMQSLAKHPDLEVEFCYQYPLMPKREFLHLSKEQLTAQISRDKKNLLEWTQKDIATAFCCEQSENPHYNQVLLEQGFRFGGDPEHIIDFENKIKYRAPLIPLKLESLPHRLFRKSQFKVLHDSMEPFDYLRLALSANSLLHLGIAKAMQEFLEPVLKERTLAFYSELQPLAQETSS